MKRLFGYIKDKSGLSLVETLTALTILMLIIFCFSPLYLTYFKQIQASGETMKRVYEQNAKMQSVLGNFATDSSGYTLKLNSVPLAFNIPSTTISKNGVSQNVAAETVVSKGVAGSVVSTNPGDISAPNTLTSVKTFSIDSDIRCFPQTLTDDFMEAHITIVANGFEFTDNNMSNKSSYRLSCTKANSSNTASQLEDLTFGDDYKLERVKGTRNILTLTLYGGTDISFENSPIVFNYMDGTYTKEIEVDAPTMIMVGEADKNGDYYYYVSRGEKDKNGNLIVLRREMESKDAKNGNSEVELISAMNDVEWVEPEQGDGNNIDANGNKYGYYVMCGDNGQIRRFWRNNATGNYYWGGDYTGYTEIILDRISPDNGAANHYKSVNTYSTETSYKFAVRRNFLDQGFNMAAKGDSQSLMSANTWSITAFNDPETYNGHLYYYASDGKLIYARLPGDKNAAITDSWPNNPNYSGVKNIETNLTFTYGDKSMKVADYFPRRDTEDQRGGVGNESLTWLKATNSSGKESFKGTDNPITLTCVDAIQLTYDPGGGAWRYYIGNDNYDIQHGNAVIQGDITDYPKKSYTLYCGYIPAAMDAWSKITGWNGMKETLMSSLGDIKDDVNNLKDYNKYLTRADGSEYSWVSQYYPKWKGNFGMTPYFTSGTEEAVQEVGIVAANASRARKDIFGSYFRQRLDYFPYTNLNYKVTGKFYDASSKQPDKQLLVNRVYNTMYNKQKYMTNGKVVDVTLAYLSQPYATHIAANPTDDVVFDMANSKGGNDVYYWHNRRETATYLDCASTMVPQGDRDIPISLLVGYVMGGLVEYSGDDLFVNTMMTNGIVMLRSGSPTIGTQSSSNATTGEYYAKTGLGYKLNQESNVFAQFYYLNSYWDKSDAPYGTWYNPFEGSHIGNLVGAQHWYNNRHIEPMSMYGGAPNVAGKAGDKENYEYLRCHPMSNTKVNCVEWGTTWSNDPEAMWGTENGTVLSWWVDLDAANDKNAKDDAWNDKSVHAELQSYRWIENCSGKTYYADTKYFQGSIGSASGGGKNDNKADCNKFSTPGVHPFNTFYDKNSQDLGLAHIFGVVSTLNSVNDICYDNDTWVVGGDQSGMPPKKYCASGNITRKSPNKEAVKVEAYTDGGDGVDGGSWVYVRYWVDYMETGLPSSDNARYFWKAVRISPNGFYNIEQVNNINGLWIATGYKDANKNGEYDDGEEPVVCWATDPLASDKQTNGWRENTAFYANNGSGGFTDVTKYVGGINSVATRT